MRRFFYGVALTAAIYLVVYLVVCFVVWNWIELPAIFLRFMLVATVLCGAYFVLLLEILDLRKSRGAP